MWDQGIRVLDPNTSSALTTMKAILLASDPFIGLNDCATGR